MGLKNIVKLENAGVEYVLHNVNSQSLKSKLLKSLTGGIISTKKHEKAIYVSALSNLNFEINPGDKIGLIGHNGAGKTTLLRLLSGIYFPTSGSVKINGRPLPLIDINLGIDPNATGIDNIRTRGLMIGIKENDMESYIKDVIKFADLGDFVHLPFRTYSAGMQARLSFGASTVIDPDILIMDEWISTGDQSFKKKANERIQKLIDKSNALIFASHSLEMIKLICNRVIWLNKGSVVMDGACEKVLREYQKT